MPLPAMSYAVPWSGDVLTIGNPAETLTPLPKLIVLKGISPWSW